MITNEILKHYEDGGKIRKCIWDDDLYIDKYGGGMAGDIIEDWVDQLDDEWEIYRELPKSDLQKKLDRAKSGNFNEILDVLTDILNAIEELQK